MTKVHPMTSVRPRRPQLFAPSGAPVPVPKVALGYPYGPISAVFMHSLLALREYEFAKMARGVEPHVRYQIPQGGIYVDHNRNEIAERFFKTDAEWLLQIDTDIEFPATIVESLLAVAARDKKVLAASVPLGPPYPSSAWMKTKTPGIWAGMPASEITAEGVKCDGIATAVCLIHREVFEAIADREGQRWFLKYEVGRLDRPASEAAWTAEAGPARDRQYVPMGEDLAFSIRAAEAGFQCWAVKVPGLRHHKVVPLSHDFDPEPEIVTSGFSQPQFVDVDLTQAEESALKEYAAKAFIDGSGETEPRGIMADFPPQGA